MNLNDRLHNSSKIGRVSVRTIVLWLGAVVVWRRNGGTR